MKEVYETPTIEIINFQTEDIMTASGFGLSVFDGTGDEDGWGGIFR
ncbi:hypothetical protein HNQ56_002882 [Anaerotaenia torta]